jgi:hypothetical protein
MTFFFNIYFYLNFNYFILFYNICYYYYFNCDFATLALFTRGITQIWLHFREENRKF